jgi:hypothetical protein
LEEASKMKEQLQDLTETALETRKEREKAVDEKRRIVQNLKRDISSKESLISKKFDCKASSFTVKSCASYCTFPYSYDSCTSSSAQRTFVQRLEATVGKCIHYSYIGNNGKKCDQIHVVVE